ncbi:uncharacterized protein CFAP97D2 [Haemorhous mexicanus]|uniref:uncharacterized protein CFAP97D2 n=1 Tax=Haemorhous mexicanus TaxID=30427 RepID=UPI0028BF416D|nr:uncharacterized protein CFAP97D2 [Haemorhous mexicanus]
MEGYFQQERKNIPLLLQIQTAKPLVDTHAPTIHRIIYLSLLYKKLEEHQLSATEREKYLLLEKMSCILRTKGQTDNKNDYKSKSLIEEKRKQWKVNQEN